MKKQRYIAAVACLVAGAIGFAGVYATERTQEKREQQSQMAEKAKEEDSENTEDLSQASTILEPENKAETEEEPTVKEEASDKEPEETKPTVAQDTLHFAPDDGLTWPIEGNVLLNYSMDSTIYFPTLEQYQYSPAIVIQGNVNDKVYLVAKGKITDITTNEVTGCTVTEDLGDGYTAIYGQLKELNFAVGDMVESGQVIGYVSEPTKYYSVEGSNVYFELQKDGQPIDPFTYLE